MQAAQSIVLPNSKTPCPSIPQVTATSSFPCLLMTKSGSLSSYNLLITATQLLIVTVSSSKVKSTVELGTMHIKEAQKQLIQMSSLSDNDTQVETPKQNATYLYPARMILPDNKSRLVFFESRQARKEAINAVVNEQGFEN